MKTKELIEAYLKEYERVNGRKVLMVRKGRWLSLDSRSDAPSHTYSKAEIEHALGVLKTRSSFYGETRE
jgi:hypothetical protein